MSEKRKHHAWLGVSATSVAETLLFDAKQVQADCVFCDVSEGFVDSCAMARAKPGIEVAKAGTCLDTIGLRCRIGYVEILTSFINLALRLGERVRDARKIAVMVRSSHARPGVESAKV
ncbi:MAG: hypothetical protein ABSB26_05315 [Nitrososphaerales archaeon]